MSNIYLPENMEARVKKFTDAGQWKHSWHWERDRTKPWGRLTLQGAKQMLNDLHCDGSIEKEVEAATAKIKERYALAAELESQIRKAEIEEVADTHPEGCGCEWCQAAGYVK